MPSIGKSNKNENELTRTLLRRLSSVSSRSSSISSFRGAGRRRSQSVAAQLDGRGRRVHLAIVESIRSCGTPRHELGLELVEAMPWSQKVAERRGPARRTRATRPPRDRRDTRASAAIIVSPPPPPCRPRPGPGSSPISSSASHDVVPRRIATRRPNLNEAGSQISQRGGPCTRASRKGARIFVAEVAYNSPSIGLRSHPSQQINDLDLHRSNRRRC